MYRLFETPIGPLYAEATSVGLSALLFPEGPISIDQTAPAAAGSDGDAAAAAIIDQAQKEITEYFDGGRKRFDVPLDLSRGTPFQRAAWQAIADIPFGQTLTYRDVAALIGTPNAYRAAGSACRLNPIVVIVPCHRVVGSDGGLHGYGGGLDKKAVLLQHEGVLDRLDGRARVPKAARGGLLLL